MKYVIKHTAAKYILGLLILMLIGSCKKQDQWLDVKRQQSDVTPKTIVDYQALLDFDDYINNRVSGVGLVGTDNLYLSNTNYQASTVSIRNLYSWQKDNVWGGVNSADWSYLYSTMEAANIVLEGLKNVDNNQAQYNNVKGQALFYRSLSLFTLAQLFCKPYVPGTASTDLGIPIRLSSDINILYPRATLQQTYQQMMDDANASAELLDNAPLNIRRPSKNAALGLLAKIYLDMQDYASAGVFADKVIKNGVGILDFNDNTLVSTATTYRFPVNGIGNPEIIFFASQQYNGISGLASSKAEVDMTLYQSYSASDLRKTYFYALSAGLPKIRGSYTGTYATFCGIATNELYLIRAECYARQGNTSAALSDLNAILKKRFVTGTYTDISAPDADSALAIILRERRKELPFTSNIRWEDLRRLNLDPKFKVTLTRTINGIVYTLPPGDPRYVLPIPDNEIQYSGIQQNER